MRGFPAHLLERVGCHARKSGLHGRKLLLGHLFGAIGDLLKRRCDHLLYLGRLLSFRFYCVGQLRDSLTDRFLHLRGRVGARFIDQFGLKQRCEDDGIVLGDLLSGQPEYLGTQRLDLAGLALMGLAAAALRFKDSAQCGFLFAAQRQLALVFHIRNSLRRAVRTATDAPFSGVVWA